MFASVLRGITLFVCLGLGVSALAATPVRVRLVDPDGSPYAGVEVSVIGRTGAAHTDDDGECELLAPPAPPFELPQMPTRSTSRRFRPTWPW